MRPAALQLRALDARNSGRSGLWALGRWAGSPSGSGRVYGPRIATLYDRLGVSRRASQDEIRAAYRTLARRHHPDRGSGGSEGAMAALNEAWRVLGDPARRASYDASLAAPAPAVGAPSAARTPASQDEDEDGDDVELDGRARWAVALPWILVLAVLTAIFFFTAYARRGEGGGGTSVPARAVDGVIEVGSCIALDDAARAVEAWCGGPHVGVTSAIVAAAAACPLRTEGFYDQEGSRLICITRD